MSKVTDYLRFLMRRIGQERQNEQKRLLALMDSQSLEFFDVKQAVDTAYALRENALTKLEECRAWKARHRRLRDPMDRYWSMQAGVMLFIHLGDLHRLYRLAWRDYLKKQRAYKEKILREHPPYVPQSHAA